MKKNIGDLVVKKELSGKITKTVCSTKGKYLKHTKRLQEEMRNFFVKKEYW